MFSSHNQVYPDHMESREIWHIYQNNGMSPFSFRSTLREEMSDIRYSWPITNN